MSIWNDCIVEPWTNFFDFHSRTSRKSYWGFILVHIALLVIFFFGSFRVLFLNPAIHDQMMEVMNTLFPDWNLGNGWVLPTNYYLMLALVVSVLSTILFVSVAFFAMPVLIVFLFSFTITVFADDIFPLKMLLLFLLTFLFPLLSMTARRLHDTGHSSLFMLAPVFFAVFGSLFLSYMLLMAGQLSENKWGKPVG